MEGGAAAPGLGRAVGSGVEDLVTTVSSAPATHPSNTAIEPTA
jgi:hypothetical protein